MNTRPSQLEKLPERIHFAGIGGAGMSGLALALHEAGLTISGSDRTETPVTRRLQDAGISLRIGQGSLPERVDLVVRTVAMPLSHPELLEAKKSGLPVMKRAELLAKLCDTPCSVAVAGTHGKTTITAMLAWLLENCVPGSGWYIGGMPPAQQPARLGEGRITACEADEYDRSFLHLAPSHLLLGKVDWDHVDTYPTRDAMLECFEQLVDNVRGNAPLILQDPEPGGWIPQALLKCQRRGLLVGEADHCDVRITGIKGHCFRLQLPGHPELLCQTRMAGAHNRRNAATALAWLLAGEWGDRIDPKDACAAMASFPGIDRRCQIVSQHGDRMLVDDYAHHPSEITACIQALRELSDGTVIVIHQPHTFSRVQAFAKETGYALSAADRVILWPVFPAREDPLEGVSHRSILPHISGAKATAVDDLPELLHELQTLPATALVATIGAGDLYLQHKALCTLLERTSE